MKTKLDTVLEELQRSSKTNQLDEMVHYPKKITKPDYQKPENFPDISLDNIKSMDLLHRDVDFLYVKSGIIGYIFDLSDMDKSSTTVKPILHVYLRDSVFGLKQAYKLRIQYKYAKNNLARTWYMNYIEKVGPIVSDTEHLEGGYRLWKSFIKHVTVDAGTTIKMVDKNTEEVILDKVTVDTPEESMWSNYSNEKDRSKQHLVLVFGENDDF